jgi:hypothetical protein
MLINPFLLAGKDQIEEYQKQRVKDWEALKGDKSVDFDHYFDKIVSQWDLEEFDQNIIDNDAFISDNIDFDASTLIKETLIDAGILNKNGFINFEVKLTSTTISTVIDNIGIFSDEEKSSILAMLENVQSNKSKNFETYSKHMFEFYPSDGVAAISSEESERIWAALKSYGVIDEYGLLLLKVNSNELSAGVNLIPGLTSDQKERVIGLLNKHPELSYASYMRNYDDEELPSVNAYLPEGSDAITRSGLTNDEYNYIRVIALLEWSMMTICQKGAFKSRKKIHERAKAEKKKIEAEEQQYLAKLEAQYKRENNRASKSKKKG